MAGSRAGDLLALAAIAGAGYLAYRSGLFGTYTTGTGQQVSAGTGTRSKTPTTQPSRGSHTSTPAGRPPSAPGAPRLVSVSATGPHAVNATFGWDEVPDASSYRVYHVLPSGQPVLLQEVQGTTLTLTHVYAPGRITLRVQSCNLAGCSEMGPAAVVNIPSPPAEPAPTVHLPSPGTTERIPGGAVPSPKAPVVTPSAAARTTAVVLPSAGPPTPVLPPQPTVSVLSQEAVGPDTAYAVLLVQTGPSTAYYTVSTSWGYSDRYTPDVTYVRVPGAPGQSGQVQVQACSTAGCAAPRVVTVSLPRYLAPAPAQPTLRPTVPTAQVVATSGLGTETAAPATASVPHYQPSPTLQRVSYPPQVVPVSRPQLYLPTAGFGAETTATRYPAAVSAAVSTQPLARVLQQVAEQQTLQPRTPTARFLPTSGLGTETAAPRSPLQNEELYLHNLALQAQRTGNVGLLRWVVRQRAALGLNPYGAPIGGYI